MHFEVISDRARLFALEDEWNEIHRRAGGTLYQTFTWNRCWWEVFGGNLGMRVLIVRDRGIPAAILPCFIQRLRFGGTSLQRLSLFGEIGIPGEYAPLVYPGREQDMARIFAEFIAAELEARADVADFHLLPHGSPVVRTLKESLKVAGLSTHLRARSLPRMIIRLPADPQAYRKMLLKRYRKTTAAGRRHLEGAGARLESVMDPSLCDAAFDDVVRLHSNAWSERGKKGYFASRPGFERFHRAVTASFMKTGDAEILFYTHRNQRFAALQLFTAAPLGCPYLSGRDTSHPLGTHSPGNVLLIEAVHRCIARGNISIDLMEGETDQKRWLGGEKTWYSRLTSHRAGVAGHKGVLFRGALSLRHLLERAPGKVLLKGSLLHLAAKMRDRMAEPR